jgi:PAS domain-containing protein
MNGLAGAAATALLVMNDEQDELVVKGRNLEEPAWFFSINPYTDGLISKCLQSTSPVLITRGEAERLSLGEIPDLKISSILAVPLIFDGQTLGVLMMMNKLRGDFNSLDRALGSCVAAVAAHSIYKSRLLRKLNIINADLEANRWQLLNSRKTLRTLFDSLPTSIYIIDPDFRLCAVNLHRARRIGQGPSELIGMCCYEALHGRADICPDCKVFDTLSSGRSTTRLKREWNLTELFEWEISYPIYSKEEAWSGHLLDQDITKRRSRQISSSPKLAVVMLVSGLLTRSTTRSPPSSPTPRCWRQELPPEDDKRSWDQQGRRQAAQVVRNLRFPQREYEYSLTDINETILSRSNCSSTSWSIDQPVLIRI